MTFGGEHDCSKVLSTSSTSDLDRVPSFSVHIHSSPVEIQLDLVNHSNSYCVHHLPVHTNEAQTHGCVSRFADCY
jgi:hypothetical protein